MFYLALIPYFDCKGINRFLQSKFWNHQVDLYISDVCHAKQTPVALSIGHYSHMYAYYLIQYKCLLPHSWDTANEMYMMKSVLGLSVGVPLECPTLYAYIYQCTPIS